MKTLTTVEHIKQNLPHIYEAMKVSFIAKHNKSKKKDVLSSNIDDCEWSFHIVQKVQSFTLANFLDNTQLDTSVSETPEEIVHNLFQSGDLYVAIEAKQKTIIVTHDFPQFNSPEFYIPQTIVDNYDDNEKPDVLPNPTIFIYVQDFLKEVYVLGGLKNIKTNEKFIVLQCDKHRANVYRISDIDNNLEMILSCNFYFIHSLNFDDSSEIKIEKIKYETISISESLSLLNGKTEWIEDSDSVISYLENLLSQSPGFFQLGTKQPNRISIIPNDTPKQYLLSTNNELKKKFNIR